MIDLSKPIFNNMAWTEIQDTPHFEACHSTDARICADVVARLQLEYASRVLVPCTGYGEYLYPLQGAHAHVTAIEKDEHAHYSQPELLNGTQEHCDFMDFRDEYEDEYDVVICNPPRAGKRVDGARPYVHITNKAITGMRRGSWLVLHLHPAHKKGKDLIQLHEYLDDAFELHEELNYYCDEYPITDVNIYWKK